MSEKQIPCLDFGYVTLIDVMGDDFAIAEAARTSTGRQGNPAKDTKLIERLSRDNHTSPFEMGEMKFKIRCPIFVARHFVRHRTASLNELSGRYSELPTDMFQLGPSQWRLQSKTNKQGSDGILSEERGSYHSNRQVELQELAATIYRERLDDGISRELARIDLPLSLYTEFIWKQDLHNLLKLLLLRLPSDVQPETQEYARALRKFVIDHFPRAYEAFRIYHIDSLTLSERDLAIIRGIASHSVKVLSKAVEFGWLEVGTSMVYLCRKGDTERTLYEQKVRNMGLPEAYIPWINLKYKDKK